MGAATGKHLVDGNKALLRHPRDVLAQDVIDAIPEPLETRGLLQKPYSVFVCMRHVEDFKVADDFWNHE